MAIHALRSLNAYPLWSTIKVGDTIPDIQAGRNAGMWTVRIVKTGNALGLSLDEVTHYDQQTLFVIMQTMRKHMMMNGANFIIESLSGLPNVIKLINEYLANGLRPN